jgi:large subunit ribosomal protein L18
MLTNYERRKFRVRNKISKNNKNNRPKITVHRSNKNTYAQLIAPDGKVIKSFSTLSIEKTKTIKGLDKAKLVGEEFAKICLQVGIKEVVFDKGAYLYNGRVKVLAEACREAGLKF